MATIGYAEFDWPDQSARSASIRNSFLETVRTLAPDVLNQLRDGPYLVYSDIRSRGLTHKDIVRLAALNPATLAKDANSIRFSTEEDSKEWVAVRCDVIGFHTRLRRWATDWHLNAVWCLLAVYRTLNTWLNLGESQTLFFELLEFGDGFFTPPALPASNFLGLAYPEPAEGLPEYNPLLTFREYYLERIRANGVRHGLLKVAKAYCEKVEQCHEAAGYPRCKPGEKRNLAQHLEWAVRFQVRSESLEEIANTIGDGGIDKSTVMRGVYDLLGFIGLEKRADATRGRKLGSENKESQISRHTRSRLAR